MLLYSNATIAQSVEQRTENPRVAGSIPARGTIMEIHMKKSSSTIFGRTLLITFMIPTAFSLKDKRQVIKSLITKIRQRFNVSIIEAGFHEQWQLAQIGIAFISNQLSFLDSMQQEMLKFIGRRIPDRNN